MLLVITVNLHMPDMFPDFSVALLVLHAPPKSLPESETHRNARRGARAGGEGGYVACVTGRKRRVVRLRIFVYCVLQRGRALQNLLEKGAFVC